MANKVTSKLSVHGNYVLTLFSHFPGEKNNWFEVSLEFNHKTLQLLEYENEAEAVGEYSLLREIIKHANEQIELTKQNYSARYEKA